MGFLSRVKNMKISVGSGALQVDPAVQAERKRQEYATRALYGPAGVAVYGPGPDPEPPSAPPEARFADLAQQSAHEFHERTSARAPYLPASPPPLTITRIPSRDGAHLADLGAFLASSGLAGRPELVYGCYRVPDHIGGSATTRSRRYVEWDVVHAPVSGLPPSPPPSSVYLDAQHQWVGRISSQPSILDEDLAASILQWAGVGPEHVVGIARQIASVSGGGGEGNRMYARMAVVGVNVLVSPAADLTPTVQQAAGAAPFDLPVGPPPGLHVEVLNWRAIAKAVQPRTGVPPTVPSPFPWLPATPQELLLAHLQVVGIHAGDCVSAQVTVDRETDVIDREQAGWLTSTTDKGMTLPCVDGKDRPRLAGATHVIVAYRDRPEYVAGRERWSAFEWDVMRARLANRTGVRRPVPAMDLGSLGKGARAAIKGAGAVASFLLSTPSGDEQFDHVPDARYCWPPLDAR
jgi:hypothetical protein